MPRVFRGEFLAAENVPQMTAAGCAQYLGPAPVGISDIFDAAKNLIVKTGPAAAGMEFAPGIVKRCITAAAKVRPRIGSRFIFTGERRFGAFVYDNLFFFRGEPVVFHVLSPFMLYNTIIAQVKLTH